MQQALELHLQRLRDELSNLAFIQSEITDISLLGEIENSHKSLLKEIAQTQELIVQIQALDDPRAISINEQDVMRKMFDSLAQEANALENISQNIELTPEEISDLLSQKQRLQQQIDNIFAYFERHATEPLIPMLFSDPKENRQDLKEKQENDIMTAQLSADLNNCGFHGIALAIFNMSLEDFQEKVANTPAYHHLKIEFAKYLNRMPEDITPEFLYTFNETFSHPYDQMMIWGPVFRTAYRSFMQDNYPHEFKQLDISNPKKYPTMEAAELGLFVRGFGGQLAIKPENLPDYQVYNEFFAIEHSGSFIFPNQLPEPRFEIRLLNLAGAGGHYELMHPNPEWVQRHNQMLKYNQNTKFLEPAPESGSRLGNLFEIIGVKERLKYIKSCILKEFSHSPRPALK